jgi:hypothetical protein
MVPSAVMAAMESIVMASTMVPAIVMAVTAVPDQHEIA